MSTCKLRDGSEPCPSIIEWRITGRCNEECAYCYGPMKHIHPSHIIVDQIVDILIASAIKIIRFSGGEPLIYSNIVSVIKRLGDAGKQVILSTNGLRFVELRRQIENYIAKLNISLDGFDARTHSLCGRTPGGFEKAIAALNSVTDNKPSYPIKVGTVLTSRNAVEPKLLHAIYDLLISKHVDRWKIYQYVPEGPIVDHSLCVSDHLFSELEIQLNSYISQSTEYEDRRYMNIKFASAESRSGAYFIIQPFGEVFIPVGNSVSAKELSIGNILTTPLTLLYNRWMDLANLENHIANTYILGTGSKG